MAAFLSETTHRMLLRYHPSIGHLFVPNQRARLLNELGGYTVVTNAAGLLSLSPGDALPLAGLFGEGSLPYVLSGYGDLPSLATMTGVALAALEDATNGFFLVVEGGRIDHACHENNIDRCIPEVIAFSDAVAVATNWASGRADTLILVTADHETGGMAIEQGLVMDTLQIKFTTNYHTASMVPVFAYGPGAELFGGVYDNTDIYRKMEALFGFLPPGNGPVQEKRKKNKKN